MWGMSVAEWRTRNSNLVSANFFSCQSKNQGSIDPPVHNPIASAACSSAFSFSLVSSVLNRFSSSICAQLYALYGCALHAPPP